MGYEVNLVVGFVGHSSPEYAEDKSRPFGDGSGYERKTDADGDPIKTGRTRNYFGIYATVDLCKPGYDSEMYALAREETGQPQDVFEFYGPDGNAAFSEDRYDKQLWPVPIKRVIEALRHDARREDYQRFRWALALLEAIQADDPEATVLMFGY